MKVWINRDTCDSGFPACLSCFGQLVQTGVPDRIEDKGKTKK